VIEAGKRRNDGIMEKRKVRIALIGGGSMGELMSKCLLTKKVALP
jgi:hypothetical protein